MQKSILRQLTFPFITLAIGPPLLVWLVLAYPSLQVQQQQALAIDTVYIIGALMILTCLTSVVQAF